MAVKILKLRLVPRDDLVGFVTVELDSGMVVSEIAIMKSADATWASPPGRAVIAAGGVLIKDEDGKIRHSRIISFATREIRDIWSAAIIEAVRDAFPEVLGE